VIVLPGTECRDVAVEGVRLRVYRTDAADSGADHDPGDGAGADVGARDDDGDGDGTGGRDTPPTLLLHGVPQTAAMWRHLLPELATDRVVIAPDLKGLGGSEVAGPYDIRTIVRELAALVVHVVDGPVDVVGHDWGGSLALALAGARPELVRRLVVISAPYRYIDYRRAPHIPFFALPLAPEIAFALGGRDLVRGMIRYCWRARTPIDHDVLEYYATAYDDPSRVSALLGYYRAAARNRLVSSRPLAGLLDTSALRGRRATRPPSMGLGRPRPERALVLWGAADPVLPIRVGEAVARELGSVAEFVTLPGVGHFVPEEAPGETTATVSAFLRAG